MKNLLIKAFIVIMLLFALFPVDFKVNANTDESNKKVLVLFAYDYGLPTVDLFLRPMHEQLLENGLKSENIYMEFLNLDRYNTHDDKQSIMNNLEQKYENIEFDIIVASTLDDANFMATYGENISPSAPLVIAGYEFEPSWVGSPRILVKMTTELLIDENVAFAFNLFPNTKNIFIVSGSSTYSAHSKSLLESSIQTYDQTITVTDSSNMSYEEMLDHVGTLSSDTVVFFTSYFEDIDGQNYVPASVAKDVSKNSAVAVFGLRDVHVYKGNLSAGIVYDTTLQGIQIADIISDYFKGDIQLNSEDIEISVAPATVINWERLTFYGASLEDISEDAIILNYEPSIWEEHRESILLLIVVIAVLIIFGSITTYALYKNYRINNRFNTIGTSTNTFTWETSADGKLRYLSKQASMIFGKEVKSLKTNTFICKLIDPNDENRLKNLLMNFNEEMRDDFTITTQFLDSNGNRVVLSSIVKPIFGFRSQLKGFLGSTQNIIDRIKKDEEIKISNEKLIQTEKQYRLVSKVSNTGVWEFRMKDNYLWCSPEYFTMLGYNPKVFKLEPNNIDQTWIDLIHPDCRKRAQLIFEKYMKEKPNAMYENTFRLKTADGDYRWIWSRGNFIRDDNGNPLDMVIGTHIDVTEQKQKDEEIRHISNHDTLTTLPNRNYYQTMLKQYDDKKNYPLGIIMMDINGLKLINDSFGNIEGNKALKQLADILLNHKREEDFVARVSGDEFAMLSPNITLDEIDSLKLRILNDVSNQYIKDISYSVSIGYAVKESTEQDTDELLREAENAMYRNKIVYGQGSRSEAIESVFATLTNKYAYEKTHSERVAKYSRLIGEKLNLSEDDLNELELAGKLHDIGKIAIDDSIIMKPGKLNEDEWRKIKDHTVVGYQILRAADKYSNLAEYALSHHERMDGKGYPNGIKGEDIHLFSRIICVADAYEAMTSNRTYRKALDEEIVISELRKHSGTQFDSEIVDVFINKVL